MTNRSHAGPSEPKRLQSCRRLNSAVRKDGRYTSQPDEIRMTESLKKLLIENEEWLMQRILHYAKQQGYSKYTSTLAEAWRVSIVGLTETITNAMQTHISPPELHPDEDYSKDPIAAFGMLEAGRHRERGVRLDMFLGLIKYYKQAYLDLIRQCAPADMDINRTELYIERCFDRLEIGFCREWANQSQETLIMELQTSNRIMTNEKNKYLTIFESLSTPIFLLDAHHAIENMNLTASRRFFGKNTPGMKYYNPHTKKTQLLWAMTDLEHMTADHISEREVTQSITTCEGDRTFHILYQRMRDISDKFIGTVVQMEDVTESYAVQRQLRELLHDKDLLIQEVHHRVKNNFTIISSLLALHANQINDETTKNSLTEAQDRIRTMMMVHQQLYSSGDISNVNFKDYTQALIRDLKKAYIKPGAAIDIKEHVEDIKLNIKQAIPCGLILNELITNAIKYAFPENRDEDNRVAVHIQQKHHEMEITVTDNGVGLPESIVIEECQSLGLRLVDMLTNQLKGTREISHENGTTFTIRFPL